MTENRILLAGVCVLTLLLLVQAYRHRTEEPAYCPVPQVAEAMP